MFGYQINKNVFVYKAVCVCVSEKKKNQISKKKRDNVVYKSVGKSAGVFFSCQLRNTWVKLRDFDRLKKGENCH